ncbi:rap guanine nucleotide exchange factor 4-like [Penaeus monodon]|uniref:rap guanine nucleotide exchange factor 4-like n=1 Tax=Penaeus monodon TaxID=6687 RepID=UPI0018A744D9|nr:rap guanine nucleotide exchange factor 4-like [Penaeus monodon]
MAASPAAGPSGETSLGKAKRESPTTSRGGDSSSRNSTPRGTPTRSSPVYGTPSREPPPAVRRPSLTRAASFDSPSVSPRRSSLRSAVLRLRCESQDTAEEDEEEEEDAALRAGSARRPERAHDDDDGDDDDEGDGEDDDDDDDDDDEAKGHRVMNGDGGKGGAARRRGSRRASRTRVEQQRSQELDSPSTAAVPIVEAPSVRICEAAWVLRTMLLSRAPHLLKDRRHHGRLQPRCGVGTELTEWLLALSSVVHSRSQAAGMWQCLLEEGALYHVTGEQPFRDKYIFYRFLEDAAAAPGVPAAAPSSAERREAEERLTPILAFLQQRAPDALLRMILRKPSHERTIEDQELIYEELLHLKALAHLSNSVKRELASVIKFESHSREGTICEYTVMSGTPQKMLEHLLETRLDGRRGSVGGGGGGADLSDLPLRRCDLASMDLFLDDFLLTHIVFMPYAQLTQELLRHYRIDSQSNSQDDLFIVACKRRVIHFVHRWVVTVRTPVFTNPAAAQFLQTLQEEVARDMESFGSALREEAGLMLSVADALERHERDGSAAGVNKWKLPTSGRPISLFGVSSHEDSADAHRMMRAQDDSKGGSLAPDSSVSHLLMSSSVIFRVYCADHTYCTLRFPLQTTSDAIKRSAADKLGLRLEHLLLVELKSNGEVITLRDKEVCPPTGLSLNGRLFVCHKDHLDALTPHPEQEGPTEGSINQLEMYSTRELAFHITAHDWDLFSAIHEYEFIYEVFGRDHFGQVMCNLDVFLRRFNELQYWVVSEMCLTSALSKRAQLLRKFIKLAAYCKEEQNLNAFFAIVIGLSNVAVTRLTQTWERLSSKFRKMYTEFEMLIDPSRNHRAYRIYVAKLQPPILPFTPLLMKGELLETSSYASPAALEAPPVPKNESEIRVYVKNLQVIDNQRRLLSLSQRLEPKRP